MTDFINYPTKPKMKKVVLTENTKEIVETIIQEEIPVEVAEEKEQELIEKVNSSKKAVAKKNKKGEVEIKQVLKG